MPSDILDYMGSVYKISELYEQGMRKSFQVLFKEVECEFSCIYLKFQFKGFFVDMPLQLAVSMLQRQFSLSEEALFNS